MPKRKIRNIALILLCLFVVFSGIILAAHAIGIRINTTNSFPKGLYILKQTAPKKGDLVVFIPPDTKIFRLATEHGYIRKNIFGRCTPLLKRLVALEGDIISIDSDGVTVNGRLLSNSKPQKKDSQNLPLPQIKLKNYRLQTGEILLMSEYSQFSFDSRYFGVQRIKFIRSVAYPLPLIMFIGNLIQSKFYKYSSI